jgi:CHAT domain-containing protein
MKFYNQALSLRRAVGDRSGEATTLNNIGLVYNGFGDKIKALEFYSQALSLRRAVGDRGGEATTLNNIGRVYDVLGEKPKALELYNQALVLYRALGDRGGEAGTLNNVGGVYDALGDKLKALEFCNLSLSLYRAVVDRTGEAITLNNIGRIYSDLGDKPKALNFYYQALPLYRTVVDRKGEAGTLNNIGSVYSDLGDKLRALDFYNQVLPLYHAVGDRNGKAITLNNIGSIYLDLGDNLKALNFYNLSLLLRRAVGDRNGEATTLNNIAYLFQKQQRLELAISFLKQSVNVYETLRADLHSLPRNEQARYTQVIAGTYRALVDFLVQEERLSEAQQVIELLKIRELKELKLNKGQPNPSTQELPISETEKHGIAQINSEIANEIKPSALPLANQLSPTNDLNRAAQALLTAQPNAVLIYQLFTKDKLWLILITPDGKLQRFASTANRAKIETLVTQFRTQIEQCEKLNAVCDQADTKTLNQTSQQLYQQLFPADLQTALKAANPQHLILALDGSLRNIPIGALHTGQQYLVEQYTLSNIIAAQLTDSQDKLSANPSQSPVLAVGTSNAATVTVPDYVDADRQDRYRPLPNVPLELDAVVSSTGKSPGAFPGHQLLNAQFTLANLRQQLPQHRLLHIGSHATFRPNFLDYSYILIGNSQIWTIPQMDAEANGKLFQTIHMVTLSTCQSGLGGRDKNGIEIAGISHAFLSQGAKTVTASLWQVDDSSTAMLMQHFYQNLAQSPTQSKAAALHQAQLHLLRTPRSTLVAELKRSVSFRLIDAPGTASRVLPTPKTADYRHPYYWASFTLIGNSR